MKKNVFVAVTAALMLIVYSCEKEEVVRDIINFEELAIGSSGYWNGSDGTGGFTSGNAEFVNRYDPDWNAWSGFAYTNHTDITTPGYDNQYSSIAGSGADGSSQYAVYYFMGSTDTIRFNIPEKVTRISLSNTTNAYLAMLNGNPFARKFGGESGNDPDWFKVVLTGVDTKGEVAGKVEIFLADFRFSNNTLDYISNVWTNIDLSALGFLKALVIEIASSDTGQYGINTPAYLCMDNLEGILLTNEN